MNPSRSFSEFKHDARFFLDPREALELD